MCRLYYSEFILFCTISSARSIDSTWLLAIYIKELSAVCPLLWILVAPKLCPMDSHIERHMALYRPIREPQDVTSLWRTRNHLFWLTMGLAPSTLQSHIILLILTQPQAYWAQTTAKHVRFIIILVRSFHIKSSQSRTLYLILTWGARTLPHQISHFYTEASRASRICQLPHAPGLLWDWPLQLYNLT